MQTRTQSTVVAVFRDSNQAQAAMADLKAAGFGANDVQLSNDTSSGASAYSSDAGTEHHEGGVTGWFKSLFGQEQHDDRSAYEDAVNRGHVMLSAHVSDENVDRVADILERHSPVDVHREAGSDTDAYSAGTRTGATERDALAGTTAGAAGVAGRTGTTQTGDRSIPVVREDLQVGKRAVLRGGVRVYSRMVEQPVEEQVRLREEHVHVERTPVNREASAADLRPGQEQSFEVKEYAEEPVVAKTARVVEEVRVGKDASERTETIRDNVRHTEVEVENLSGRTGATGATTAGSAKGQTGAFSAATSAAGTGAGYGTDFDSDYRRDFEQNYAGSGGRYEEYQPAYQYGYTNASDPRYRGRSWDEVEPSLRQDYSTKYSNSTWDRMKNSIRYGWDRVSSKA